CRLILLAPEQQDCTAEEQQFQHQTDPAVDGIDQAFEGFGHAYSCALRVATPSTFVKHCQLPSGPPWGRLRAMHAFIDWLGKAAVDLDPWLLFLLLFIPFVATLVLVPW